MHVFLQSHPDGLSFFVISLVTVLRLAAHFSICSVTFNNTPMLLFMYMEIPRFVLGVAILVLTVIRAWRQLVEMYKATKQWRLNQCIQQLVRDGIIYFLMYVFLFPSSPLISSLVIRLRYSSHSGIVIRLMTPMIS